MFRIPGGVAVIVMLLAAAPAPPQSRAPDLREMARTLDPAIQAIVDKALKAPTPGERASLLRELNDEEAAISLFIAATRAEPDAAGRKLLIEYAYSRPHLAASAEYRRMLTDFLARDPDPEVVAIAHRELRHMLAGDLHDTIVGRVRDARAAGAVPAWLAREEQIAIDRRHDLSLARFMREPPPVFAAAPPGQAIRVLAMGDQGVGDEAQRRVAAAMRAYDERHPFTLGITLGDNFYGFPRPESPSSPRWQRDFEDLYGPMGVPIYASLGNHDLDVPDQAAAEYMYSRQSQVWKLPALWYTFTAGPVQFFAIDSNDIGAEQLAWLDDAIGRSTARWKIVYGHVPLVIAMQHTPRGYPRSVQEWRDKLMPIFKGRVDLYLAGHHHSLQHLKPLDGVALVISGAGGRAGYPIDPKSPEAFFADNQHGFAVLDITNDDIGLTLVNADGKTLYTASVAKR